MDLSNINLLDLQTSYMKNDPTTVAMCAALNPQFKQLANETKSILIYSRIDDLDESVVDELAWQMHVDWYNASLDIETKRKLVKNSLKWHKKKGTPEAVEEIATTVFGRSKLEEWFEYGGEPFFFRMNIEVSKQGASQENLILLEQLINAYKNKRSWIEVINIFLTSNAPIYFGSCINSGEEITIYPWSIQESISIGVVNIGTGQQFIETTTVYPKEAS